MVSTCFTNGDCTSGIDHFTYCLRILDCFVWPHRWTDCIHHAIDVHLAGWKLRKFSFHFFSYLSFSIKNYKIYGSSEFNNEYCNYLTSQGNRVLGGVMGDFLGATICMTELIILCTIHAFPFARNLRDIITKGILQL